MTVGKIVGTHGIRGTMKIRPLTDFPQRFVSMESLTVERAGKPPLELEVESIAPYEGKELFLFTTPAIKNCEDADLLRGALVTVARGERVELEEDEFWVDDIKGADVADDATGESLGRVEDVLRTGSNDVYEVRKPDGSLGMIPAIASVVLSIDVERKRITVALPEGLWD